MTLDPLTPSCGRNCGLKFTERTFKKNTRPGKYHLTSNIDVLSNDDVTS